MEIAFLAKPNWKIKRINDMINSLSIHDVLKFTLTGLIIINIIYLTSMEIHSRIAN